MQVVCFPTQGGRHYATEMRRIQNIASGQQSITIDDDVTDIDDFMCCNIFVCICCCWPLGLAGLIFSIACSCAKSKGKREQAERYSAAANYLCITSVIFGIVATRMDAHIHLTPHV